MKEAMAKEGIFTRAYFSPVHLQPYIRGRLGTKEGMLPVTVSVARRTIALPFHGNMTEAEVDMAVEALKRCVEKL